jgi:hypothetical protein
MLGGGSTTAGCGTKIGLLDVTASMPGAGATTDSASIGAGSSTFRLTWGAGAMTGEGIAGSLAFDLEFAITAAGIVGCVCDQATTLGSGTSLLNFNFGGVTMVCLLLSASGGTETIGCAA